MSQSRRFDPQHEELPPSRRWWRGRWRSWWSIIRLLPAASRVAVAAMLLNLVTGLLPLGFAIGTSVAIGRVTGDERIRGGVLLAVGLAVVSLLLQSVLSPFQAAFTELVSRRVDGACARRLMRATAERLRLAKHLLELATSTGPVRELRLFGAEEEILRRQRDAWNEVTAAMWRAGCSSSTSPPPPSTPPPSTTCSNATRPQPRKQDGKTVASPC